MKKLLSVALALALMMSISVSAFAEVTVDGEVITPDSQGSVYVVVEEAHSVTLNDESDRLILNTFKGINGEGETSAVNASKGIAVFSLRVSQSGSADAIVAKDGADVAVRFFEVKETGTGSAINASGIGTKVAIDGYFGSVDESGIGDAINATGGANVIITRSVTEKGDGDAISASGESTKVTVGAVTEDGAGDAITAAMGAEVTVGETVTEGGDGNAIYATEGATVTVGEDVEKSGGGNGNAITATEIAKVIVGGNVTGRIVAVTGTVIVEGTVKGTIDPADQGNVYIGNLDGNIEENDLDSVHYLIGFADDSLRREIELDDNRNIIEEDLVSGVEKKYQYFTTTADADTLSGAIVILKPNDSSKLLTVSGFDGADVKYAENADGTVSFTLGDAFKGGLQNLVLILADKPASDSEPVYYIVPLGSVTVVEFTAPDGVAEGLIKALDSADHAGLTVDSSLVGDGSVKVLKDGEELNANDFSIYTHADGSIDVILSSTYLYSLGNGSYDFTAIVGGLEIPFTVAVAK